MIPGWATHDPEKLCPCIRALYVRFKAHVEKDLGIPITCIETMRDLERQKFYLEQGTSQTLHSYHLPQPPKGLALAFDVAPIAYLALKGWAPGGPLWARLGQVGRDLGLEWGGDWTGGWKDKPHFQAAGGRCHCALDKGVTP